MQLKLNNATVGFMRAQLQPGIDWVVLQVVPPGPLDATISKVQNQPLSARYYSWKCHSIQLNRISLWVTIGMLALSVLLGLLSARVVSIAWRNLRQQMAAIARFDYHIPPPREKVFLSSCA